MKNLFSLALAVLLFSSCKKLDELSTPGKTLPGAEQPQSQIENLGHVFSGSNINWTLHPLDAGHTPLLLQNEKRL